MVDLELPEFHNLKNNVEINIYLYTTLIKKSLS